MQYCSGCTTIGLRGLGTFSSSSLSKPVGAYPASAPTSPTEGCERTQIQLGMFGGLFCSTEHSTTSMDWPCTLQQPDGLQAAADDVRYGPL
eukprot:6968840-Pyramimonas_sp.AAC.1